MHLEALEKVIRIARRNTGVLLSPGFFEKICTRLDMQTARDGDYMIFTFGEKTSQASIITPQNCERFKCRVEEGKSGIMIYEFINVLVHLLTDQDVPPSPHEKLGQNAAFYCQYGTGILEEKLLQKSTML